MSDLEDAHILDSARAGAQTARGAGLRIVTYGASLVVSLATLPIVISYLTPGEFVAYSVASSIAAVALGTVDAGLVSLGLREYAIGDIASRTRLMRNLLGFRICLGLLGVVAATLFAVVSGRSNQIIVGTAFMTSAGAVAMAQQAFTIPLSAELRNGVVAMLDLLKNVVVAAGNILLVILSAGLTWFYAMALASSAAVLGVSVPFVSNAKHLRPSYDRSEWKRLSRTMLPYAAATAVSILYFRVALVAMDFVASKAATSRFALSFRIIEAASYIPWLGAATALPVMSRAAALDRKRLADLAKIMYETAVAAGLGVALVVAGSAPLAVSVLGAGEYPEAAEVLRVQAIALAFTAAAASLSVVLLALGRFRAVVINGILAALAALVLTLALGGRFGEMGGGIATLVAECVVTLGYAVAVYRIGPDLGLRGSRPLRAVAAAAITAAAIAAVTAAGQPLLGGVAALLYVPLVVLFGGVPPLVMTALRSRVARP
jgi:O-antigen/teichoic acid export membrane protein